MLFALLPFTLAATLPGISLPFDVDATGQWVLPAELPAALTAAGVQPGWALQAVDGLKLGTDPQAAQRIVAAGPARAVRLHFGTPTGETIVVVQRSPLVVVEELGLLPWSEWFAKDKYAWATTEEGTPVVVDGQGDGWVLDPTMATQLKIPSPKTAPLKIPDLWWSLTDATWVLLAPSGILTGDRAWAEGQFLSAARFLNFKDQAGDHLALPTADGLRMLAVRWPDGTPSLPVCDPGVPETCLVAGREIVQSLLDRPGGKEEALRVFGVACAGGTFRACLEATAIEEPGLSNKINACADRKAAACHEVARTRLASKDEEEPSQLLVGVLEYACSVDASGSLGERLRRLEDVGEGCMLLSQAFDKLQVPDRALLSLDQACVLGRSEACDEGTRRRQDAFALKTVRECEDPRLPLSTSCVELGDLLQAGPISATRLDSFSAYLKACKLGDQEGCTLLGDYVDRWGIDHPRVQQAERSLKEACEASEQQACVGAAHLLVRHEPKSEAYAEALGLFDASCKAGIAGACISGAEQRRIGKAKKVEAMSPMEMWEAACEKDSPAGCAGLGERFAQRKATWDNAYEAWNKACNTGDAGACTQLGKFVLNRHSEPWPQEQPSRAYLKQGCENGSAEGCYWLAEADLPKKGDPPEPAYLLLEQACEGDYGTGCADLAHIHRQRNSNFDDELAADFLQQACDNGHFESCRDLSTMYLRGEGVEKDPAKARELAQRYSVNASRRFFRFGLRLGFPAVAGARWSWSRPSRWARLSR